MLNLAHCSKLEVIPPNVLSSLEKLEILYMGNSFNKWQAEASSKGNQNASLGELRHLQRLSSLEVHIPHAFVLPKDLFLKTSLERYRIFIGEGWKWEGKYETSKTLKLKLKTNIHLEHGIEKLLEIVEDLYLEKLNGITNIVYDLDRRGFPNLKHLQIENSGPIEYVVNNTKCLDGVFPNLETLNLYNLDGLEKLCNGKITTAFFRNLKVIKVQRCNELKSIFSFSMTGLFSHLEEIVINRCRSMKEIVASTTQDTFDEQKSAANVITFSQLRLLEICNLPALTTFYFEGNATDCESDKISKSLLRNEVSFPKLERLKLASINNFIISVWDDRLPQNSFRNLKSLIVEKCGFVKLVPLHVLKSLSNLAMLEVLYCELLETVFDFEELNSDREIQSSLVVPLKELKLCGLPKLKNVWSNDTKGMVSFQNLQKVIVDDCKSLTSVFLASIAKGILHLEELQIRDCGIDVIVAKDESGATKFVFPWLTSLTLWKLPNLRNFYAQRHTSEWPRLQKLYIVDCDKLEIFENEVSSSSTIQEQETPDSKYPLILHEKVIPNLEHLTLRGKYAQMICNGQFPFYFGKVKMLGLDVMASPNNIVAFLKKFPNLERLQLGGKMGETVFPCMEPLGDVVAPFTQLSLFVLKEVKHIWNEHSQSHILQNLESLDVMGCQHLKNLGPSFISLRNLTEIKVLDCERMINLLTSQTTRTLVQLKRLEIRNCEQIEEIITKLGEDVEKKIVFSKLEYLRLYELPSLKRFCSHSYNFMFPLLGQVIIRKCPKLSMFCPGDTQTPLLKGMKVTNNDILWETNLNRTIQLWYTQQVEHLKLDEHPDMKNIWDGKPPHHLSFSRLKSLVVDNCDFLFEYVIPTHLIRFLSNLEELKVSNCHSVMTIFDMKGIIKDEDMRLDHLPNLEHVWSKDHDGTNSFQCLQKLCVSKCDSLKHIFVASIAKGLTELKRLVIESCGVEVIITEDETSKSEASPHYVFPQLSYLSLQELPKLTSLYPRRYTCKCPLLRDLYVYQCENLQVFDSQMTTTTELFEENGVETRQPIFLIEMIIPELQHLTLSGKCAEMIWNNQSPFYFRQVVMLSLDLDASPNNTAAFLYGLLKKFSNLRRLKLKGRMGEMVFPCMEPLGDVVAPFITLDLNLLYEVKHIWNDHSQPHILQNLQCLDVGWCQDLINLGPSFISLENLIEINVRHCERMINLLTSQTARSLVQVKSLQIWSCERIEEIITKQREDAEKEIVFQKLKYLKLHDLPSLKSFCSYSYNFMFPLLGQVVITKCPKLSMFCSGDTQTPLLKGVKVTKDDMRWETNLNRTIQLWCLQ